MSKNTFKMSLDELEHWNQAKEKSKEPARKAVEVLEAAINYVLEKMGIDVAKDNIKQQQDALGILIQENTDEWTPQINGFYFYQTVPRITPYAWVGSARLTQQGRFG